MRTKGKINGEDGLQCVDSEDDKAQAKVGQNKSAIQVALQVVNHNSHWTEETIDLESPPLE